MSIIGILAENMRVSSHQKLEDITLAEGTTIEELSAHVDDLMLKESFNIDMSLSEAITSANIQDEVLSESVLSGAVDKVKTFFKKVCEGIKAIYRMLRSYIDQLITSNSKFVEKYRKVLEATDTKDFSYKGFEWAINDVNIEDVWGQTSAIAGDAISKFKNEKTSDEYDKVATEKKTIIDKMYDTIVNGSKISNFNEKLDKQLRGGKTESMEIKSFKVSEMLDAIESMKDDKKICKEAETLANDAYSDCVNGVQDVIDATKKTLGENEKEYSIVASKNMTLAKDLYGASLTVVNKTSNSLVKAIKARSKEYRAALGALYRKSQKGAFHSESFTDDIFSKDYN